MSGAEQRTMGWLKQTLRARNRREGQVFDRQADSYHRKRATLGLADPARVALVLDRALDGLERLDTAADIGGGTGLLTGFLADRFDRVVLLDIAPKMLDVARRDLAARTNVSFVEGDVFAGSLAGQQFDCVLCADVMHHTGRHPELTERMCALLRPGGRLLVMEYTPGRLHTRMATFVEDLFMEDIHLIGEDDLARLCRRHGVAGESLPVSRWEYLFVGTAS